MLWEHEGNLSAARAAEEWIHYMECFEYELQLLNEMVAPERVLVHVCGHQKAGKTNLVQRLTASTWSTWFSKTTTAEDMVGVQNHLLALGSRKFLLADYGGQVEFQMIRRSNPLVNAALFIITASLVDQDCVTQMPRPAGVIAQELNYWYSFLQSISPLRADQIAIALTHLDCMSACADVDAVVDDLTRLLTFATGTIQCMDTTRGVSAAKQWLCDCHPAMIERSAHIPRLCLEVSRVIYEWRTYRLLCTLEELVDELYYVIATELATAHVDAAVSWIEALGDVFSFASATTTTAATAVAAAAEQERPICIDPATLCEFLLTKLFPDTPMNTNLSVDLDPSQCILHMDELEAFASGLTPSISSDSICKMLEHFMVGLRADEHILVPSRLNFPRELVIDFEQLAQSTAGVIGRRLSACTPHVFAPGFFQLLQIRAVSEHAAVLWRGGLFAQPSDNIFVVIEASHGETFPMCMDVVLFARSFGVDELKQYLELFIEFIREVTETELSVNTLGPNCIRRARFVSDRCTHPERSCEAEAGVTHADLMNGHFKPQIDMDSDHPLHLIRSTDQAQYSIQAGLALDKFRTAEARATKTTESSTSTKVALLKQASKHADMTLQLRGGGEENGDSAAVRELRHQIALALAKAILDEDILKYEFIWMRIPLAGKLMVKEAVAGIGIAPCDAKQPSLGFADTSDENYLVDLFKLADASLPEFRSMLEQFDGGDNTLSTGLKKAARATEKALQAYGGDFSQLKDIIRASIVLPSIDQVAHTLTALKKQFHIVRIKNRFDPDFDAAGESGGYCDLQIIIQLPHASGLLAEIQLHITAFYDRKKTGGHKAYIQYRTITERLQAGYLPN